MKTESIMPSVSIITVSYNSARTIADTIRSVLSQTYPNVEYIIVDGGSTDGTTDLINSFGKRITAYISEPDKGIYDAINKGIKLSTGNIIGILHSDDYFSNHQVIEKIAETFNKYKTAAVTGDVQFVDPGNPAKIIRYYSSKYFHPGKFRFGFMPAHPAFYAKRELFDEFGFYKTDYMIAADFELLIRFMYINQITFKYLEMPFVTMRTGGISNKSIMSYYILNKEIARACRENGIRTNYLFIYSKYFRKIFEFFGNSPAR